MQTGRQWIESNTSDLVALAQAIWEYAEVGLREERSAAAQADYLRKAGFNVQHGVATMPTALMASWGEGEPIIGFLGEYDALPELSQQIVPYRAPVREGAPGHGCGHNLLGVGSLAAAIALACELQAGRIPGTVRYYGCPAEETYDAKALMAKHGLFNDLAAAITWHPGSLNAPTYARSLAMNAVRFAFHGRTAHAAGAPHMGISALDAVELMNVGVNYLREHVIQEARIHYVITYGGGQPNVVPEYAEVWYYIRAPHRQDVEEIYPRIVRIAEGASLMTGARLEIKFESGTYDYLANRVVTEVLEESLHKVGPAQYTDEERALARGLEDSFGPGQKLAALRSSNIPPEYWELTLHEGVAAAYDRGKITSGSTDVADVSWVVPTGQITAATYVLGTSGHSWQATAASGCGIGYKGMIVAAQAMALAGYELATRPDLRQSAREAFLADTGGKPYVSHLPDMEAPTPRV